MSAATPLDDHHWMREAIALSRLCPPSEEAYSVGAIVVSAEGHEIAQGYSRESDPKVHAEESALSKIPSDHPGLRSATIYSTLEPCSQRASRPRPCTQLILDARIPRVVIAWREPSLFVADCQGTELLRQAGVDVVELTEHAKDAKAVNAHLPISDP
ncbi:deaminase [Haloechinothrix sp. LS1_15]|uniref:deaminase n=1 Tax=Haloechinothrix sp. LS1_15 TaxID=2652248 RepID=UPI0029444F1A|nr:deaminase [Haloechinothrix sp. LS1_15]MDV6014018.1 dCMP deaminase [Haloechinothrix sp. LS1_15]